MGCCPQGPTSLHAFPFALSPLLSVFPALTTHPLLPPFIHGRAGRDGNEGRQRPRGDLSHKHMETSASQVGAPGPLGLVLADAYSRGRPPFPFHRRLRNLLPLPHPPSPHSSRWDWIQSRSLSSSVSHSIHTFPRMPLFRSAATEIAHYHSPGRPAVTCMDNIPWPG